MVHSKRPVLRGGVALIILLSAQLVSMAPALAAPPANDDLASSATLTGPLPASTSGSNVDATKEAGEPDHAGNPGGRSVWYSWTAAGSGAVEINTCGSDFDTLLAVYTGDTLASLTGVASNDDGCGTASLVTLEAAVGVTYRIAVDGWNGAEGSVELHVRQPVAPPNDDIVDAEVVIGALPVTVSGTNVDASAEPGEPQHGGPSNGGGRSVWYAWTPAVAARVRVDACGSDFGTLVRVYTGVAVNALTPAGLEAPAPCGAGISAEILDASAGTTYRIVVDGIQGQEGSVQLNIDPITPPVNDDFDDAQAVAGSLPLTVSGTSVDATKETGEPDHSGAVGGHSVWYSWTAALAGPVVVASCDSDFTSVLGVYTGDELNGLTEVGVRIDAPCAGDVVALDAIAGTTYTIAIDGFIGDEGLVVLTIRAPTPPPNDDFDAAVAVGGSLPATAAGTNLDATKEAGEPDHAGNPGGSSIWYSWTPTSDGPVVVDTCDSSIDTLLAVYVGSSLGSLAPVADDDDACGPGSLVQLDATAGTTYRIAVDGLLGNRGRAQGPIVLRLREQNPPANDDFLAARVLTGALPIKATGTNVDATKEPGEPDHGDGPGGGSVWYVWTAGVSGPVTIDTCGSDFDTALAVYLGGSVGSLTEVAVSNDHRYCNVRSLVTFEATAGVSYHIAVDGSLGSGLGAYGRVELEITEPPPNDDRVAAGLLTGSLPLTVSGSTFNASKEAAEPLHGGNAGGRSVWYAWTPGTSGEVTIDTCNAAFDTLLGVYVETAPGSLIGVAGNDDACGEIGNQSRVTFDATAGTEYLIAVDGFYSQLGEEAAFGSFTLRVFGDEEPPLVPHDAFADAAAISGSLPVTVAGTTVGATAEVGEPDHAGEPAGASVWYSWTAPATGPISLDTCDSDFDTVLAVYAGDALDSLVEVASNDNAFGFCLLGSQADFEAVAGTTYRIAVDGGSGLGGFSVLTVSSNDLAPPDTTIGAGPVGPTLDSTPSFGLAASEAGSTFECSLDGAAFDICESGDAFGPLGTGPHTLAARAIDPAGNIDPTPATRVFQVVSCSISGTPWSDLLLGTAGHDVICAGSGNDIVVAGRGDDIIFAGAGHDLILAGRGRDHCDGGSGIDFAIECEARVDIP